MFPRGEEAKSHDAYTLLQRSYAKGGCPVDCGRPWTQKEIEAMLKKGAHKSAYAKDAVEQLIEETKDKVKHGYAKALEEKILQQCHN